MIANCTLCGFTVPWDKIGAELMKAHIRDEHPEVSP